MIPKFVLSPLIQRAHHEVDHDGRAHRNEAEAQEGVHQREVGNVGHTVANQDLVGDAGQDSDERDAGPITERRRSIQNTENESNTITVSGMMTNRFI